MSTESAENQSASSEKIWTAHIKACSRSGLSRREYCRRYNLSYHAFTYWKKKLFPQKSAGASFVAVPVRSGTVNHTNGQPALRVEVAGRFKVEIQDEFSPRTLARLITTLEGCQ